MREKDLCLQSNNNSYRILVIADIQVWKPLNTWKRSCLNRLIEVAAPDLIVLLGDMICGPVMFTERRIRAVLYSILKPIWKKKIPYVFVAGNHDQDTRFSLDKQIKIYRESSLCMTPPLSERSCSGAYTLLIKGVKNKTLAKLLFLDSGKTKLTSNGIKYLPPDKTQLVFSERELGENNQAPVFVFQHVPVPDIYRLIKTENRSFPGAVRGHGPYRGRFLSLKEQKNGVMGEAPCPSWENTRQFAGWTRSGRIVAALFGHDHKNSFVGKVDGVSLIQIACAGLSCYGTDSLRGGQLLILYPDGSWKTKALYYRDIL